MINVKTPLPDVKDFCSVIKAVEEGVINRSFGKEMVWALCEKAKIENYARIFDMTVDEAWAIYKKENL